MIAGGGRAPPTAPPPPAAIATASADPKRSHPRTREFPTARRSPASTRRSASAANGRIAMEIGLLEGSAAHTEPNGVTEITSDWSSRSGLIAGGGCPPNSHRRLPPIATASINPSPNSLSDDPGRRGRFRHRCRHRFPTTYPVRSSPRAAATEADLSISQGCILRVSEAIRSSTG